MIRKDAIDTKKGKRSCIQGLFVFITMDVLSYFLKYIEKINVLRYI